MRKFNLLFAIILALPAAFSNASLMNINAMDGGAATDRTSDGIFNSLYSRVSAHAQVTNYRNIYTVTRGMLEFDISGLVSPISEASFDFYASGYSGPNTTVNLLGYKGDGSVKLSDAYLGDTLVNSLSISSAGSFSIDVTDYINTLILRDTDYLGLNIRIGSEYTRSLYGYDNEIKIFGFGYGNSAVFHAPRLSISSVPEPSAIFLMITALLVLYKRKKGA